MALFSRRLVAIAPFRLAAIGAAVVLAAQLASAFVTQLPVLLCVRAVSGIGASFALLAASILISRRPDPDRYIARLDRSGTVVAYLNSAVRFTQAATPLFAGELIEYGSYQSLGLLLGAGTPIATTMIVPACLTACPPFRRSDAP